MPLETFVNEESNLSVRQKLNNTIEMVNTLETDIDGLSTTIESMDASVTTLSNTVETLTESNSALAETVSDLTTTSTALTNGLQSVTTDLGALTSRVDELSETVDDLIESGGGGTGGQSLIFPDIEYTGNWITQFNIFSTPPSGLTIFPGNIKVEGDGAWVTEIYIEEDSRDGGLSSMSFENLAGTVEDLSFRNMKEVETLSFPELKLVGDDIYFDDLPNLTTLELPELTAVLSDFNLYELTSLTEFNLPSIKIMSYMNFERNDSVTSLSMPQLTQFIYLYITQCPELNSIDLSELKVVKEGIDINNCQSLTSLVFPNLEEVSTLYLNYDMENLTHFRYGSSVKRISNQQNFSGCSLDKPSIDHIMDTLVYLDGTNGTTEDTGISLYIDGNNSPLTIENAVALRTLWDRSINVYANYAEQFSFNMTAGTAGTAIGYIDGVTGSVDNSTVATYLRDLNVDNGVLNLRFEDIAAIGEFINSRSLWIDEVLYSGNFYNNDGFIFFESDAEADIPTFVNGQTYNILIGNPT